ncbi:MAG TPA: DUF4124 domain-containing protein [Ramlibacter sp.]|jgi:hypothetical protein|uniref:DUF4124 domain-containing protein n=1 Tax=Ramlibacter sp. TaxID=1917967 RepID=UPI002D33D017|nr:DUF4124 domain-containing protein [Ramlibacter sp.]HZY19929.1 DUF4124 domain-containing protein [Ramlibacter sp.]
MPSIRAIAPLLLAAASAGAGAQTIWRCADNTYSQQPCERGSSVADAPAPPTAAERARSQAAAQRDARLADAMEKDRLRQETAARATSVVPASDLPRPEAHKWPDKAGTRKLDVFTATVPGSAAARKKEKAKTAKPSTDKAAATAEPGRMAAGGRRP